MFHSHSALLSKLEHLPEDCHRLQAVTVLGAIVSCRDMIREYVAKCAYAQPWYSDGLVPLVIVLLLLLSTVLVLLPDDRPGMVP